MSLSYKPNQGLGISTLHSPDSHKKKSSYSGIQHLKKITFNEIPTNQTAFTRLSRSNLFYSRNLSLKKPKEMTQTNGSTFYLPSKKTKEIANLSQNKSPETKIKNSQEKLQTPRHSRSPQPVFHHCIEEFQNIKSQTLEDEHRASPIQNLSKIMEENLMTEVLPTEFSEFSEIVVQELPCTKLFNNPKIGKKASIESSNHESSTKTSSAYLGGKVLATSDFSYERSINKDKFLFIVTNRDTGEKHDINLVNQQVIKQDYLEKLLETKNVWQNWWQEKRQVNLDLFNSVKCNNIISVSKLLEITGDLKPDINAFDEKGWSPLHYACLIGNYQIASLLISKGADIEILNNIKQNPLIIATQKGYENLVYLLLGRGCKVNTQDISNNTALHYACIYGHIQIIRTLLSARNIDINLKNIEGKTALQAAPSDYEIYCSFDAFMKARKQENPQNNLSTALKGKRDPSEKLLREDKPAEIVTGPNSFNIVSLLGKGSFAEVYLAERKSDKKFFAMKVLHKSKIKRDFLSKYALGERNILSSLNHPFIVKLHYAFQTKDEMFLLLTYCPGGDLGQYLVKEKTFSEEKAKFYTCEVLLALEHLHSKDVIYRDLKPDNVVLDSEGHVKLTDFGLSKEGIFDGTSTYSFCGSIAYLAPEILRKTGHTKTVDWYLLGVFLYEMLTGVTPYYSGKKEEIFDKISGTEAVKIPDFVSSEARDLLIKLLEKEPNKRLGAKFGASEIKSHPFFRNIHWESILERKMIAPYPYLNNKKNLKPCFVEFEEKGNSKENALNGWSFLQNSQR